MQAVVVEVPRRGLAAPLELLAPLQT